MTSRHLLLPRASEYPRALGLYPGKDDLDNLFAGSREAATTFELVFGFVGCSDVCDEIPAITRCCIEEG